MSEPTLNTLDIHSKDLYVSRGYPWQEWDLLRREAPIFWYEREDIAPFWAITRHADILTISKRADVFVNSRRLRLQTIEEDERQFGSSRMRAEARGFLLGELECDSRTRRRNDSFRFRQRDSGTALVTVQGAHRDQRDYVGLVVPREVVLRHLILADGSDASAWGVDVRIETCAIRRVDAKTSQPWREVPIKVVVGIAGKAPFELTFRLADGPLPHFLVEPE